MNDMFEEFVKKLSHQFKRELPGFSAQNLMAPLGRKSTIDYLSKGLSVRWNADSVTLFGEESHRTHSENKNVVPKKSAVLILLFPDSADTLVKTVLILRPENEGGSHAGQISFPGGGYDESDGDLFQTALRETEEEIGVGRKSVSLIGALTPLYIPVSNYLVHPFVGACKEIPEFKIHLLEVKELLEVDAEDFFSERYKDTSHVYVKTRNTTMEVPCYKFGGKIIWGATAMIISEFSEIIKRTKQ